VLAESYLKNSAFLPKPYTVEQLLTTLAVHFRISPQPRRQPRASSRRRGSILPSRRAGTIARPGYPSSPTN
jgi:hypothetical protein